jgi:hypothetical protein
MTELCGNLFQEMHDFIALLSGRKRFVCFAANFIEFTTIEMPVEALHGLIRRLRSQSNADPHCQQHVNQE